VRPRAASHHAQNQPHGGRNIECNVFDLVGDREALPTQVPAASGKFLPSSLTEPRAEAPRKVAFPVLGHDPEEWVPVFRKDHAQKKMDDEHDSTRLNHALVWAGASRGDACRDHAIKPERVLHRRLSTALEIAARGQALHHPPAGAVLQNEIAAERQMLWQVLQTGPVIQVEAARDG
jgi:hypothetical protein